MTGVDNARMANGEPKSQEWKTYLALEEANHLIRCGKGRNGKHEN
jgi:hypothetical protein